MASKAISRFGFTFAACAIGIAALAGNALAQATPLRRTLARAIVSASGGRT
jgi:hypothetical protein